MSADLILYNGKILTVDSNFSITQAVASVNGRIIAVGDDEDVLKLSGPATIKIDLEGKSVIPGLFDAHAHMDREGLKSIYLSLAGAKSISDIRRIIQTATASVEPGEWITTMPVGDPPFYHGVPAILQENRFPTRWDLDEVSPNNPVYIRGIWGYWDKPPIYSVANSYALRLAGIDENTAPPYDGITIFKDSKTGKVTGVFAENNYVPTVEFNLMGVAPRFTHDLRVTGLKDSVRAYNSLGTTGVYEGHGIASEVIRAYKSLWAEGQLSIRSHLVISPTPGKSISELEEMFRDWAVYADGSGFGDGILRIGGIFVQAGGKPNIANFIKREVPYTGWGSYYYNAFTSDEMRQIIFIAAKYGLRVNTIADTKGALDFVLNVYEEVNRAFPIHSRRWVIEHLGEVSFDSIQRMKTLGVIPTAIPGHSIWKDGSRRAREIKDRGELFAPYKTILDNGLPLAVGTDNSPPNPFICLGSLAARRDNRTKEVLEPHERLDRRQALRTMTINGAYLTFEEHVRGSIEQGKYADMVVLAQDYMTVPEDEIKDITVLMTIVGGQIVYQGP